MALIDLHIHGAFGVDILTASPEELDRLAVGLAERGVGAFLPTLVPVPIAELAPLVARLSAWIRSRRPEDGRGAVPLGIHFEGPFVSPRRSGALHPACLLDASDPWIRGAFLEAAAAVPGRTMVTVAPEIPGGVALVRELVRRDFIVSIGHTEADVATLDEAFRAGARHMTHFGNAMRPLHHRDVGPVGWGFLRDDVTVDVIADLHHLSPEMLRLVFKSKGADRVALISDAAPLACLPDGDHEVWGERLRLTGGVVRNAAGALAGSAALLGDGVANLRGLGLDAERVLAASETVPRRVLDRA